MDIFSKASEHLSERKVSIVLLGFSSFFSASWIFGTPDFVMAKDIQVVSRLEHGSYFNLTSISLLRQGSLLSLFNTAANQPNWGKVITDPQRLTQPNEVDIWPDLLLDEHRETRITGNTYSTPEPDCYTPPGNQGSAISFYMPYSGYAYSAPPYEPG